MPDRNRLAELLMSGYNHEDAGRYGVSDPSPTPLHQLWASQKPLLQDFLLKALTYAPMAMPASRAGAGNMRDIGMAGRLERDMPRRDYNLGRFRVEGDPVDPGITGGEGMAHNSALDLIARHPEYQVMFDAFQPASSVWQRPNPWRADLPNAASNHNAPYALEGPLGRSPLQPGEGFRIGDKRYGSASEMNDAWAWDRMTPEQRRSALSVLRGGKTD